MTKTNGDKRTPEDAANTAAKVAAEAVRVAEAVVAKASETAAKLLTPSTLDHDLIIKLGVKIDDLKEDIKELKDGTARTIQDHEVRIRSNTDSITKIMTYGSAGMIALGVLQFIVSKYF